MLHLPAASGSPSPSTSSSPTAQRQLAACRRTSSLGPSKSCVSRRGRKGQPSVGRGHVEAAAACSSPPSREPQVAPLTTNGTRLRSSSRGALLPSLQTLASLGSQLQESNILTDTQQHTSTGKHVTCEIESWPTARRGRMFAGVLNKQS